MLEYYRFKVISNLFLKGQTEAACMQLRELQKRYVALCEENTALKANIREFEDILFMQRNFIFDGNFYWLRTGNIKQGPFCPHCYDHSGQMTRLAGLRVPVCSACGAVFEDQEQAATIRSLRVLAAQEQMKRIVADGEKKPAPQTGRNIQAKTVLLPFVP